MVDTKPASKTPLAVGTDALFATIANNNRKSFRWLLVCVALVAAAVLIGVVEINKQNQLAEQQVTLSAASKDHLDCIVKLLATPQPPGTTHKFIDDLPTCNISFTK